MSHEQALLASARRATADKKCGIRGGGASNNNDIQTGETTRLVGVSLGTADRDGAGEEIGKGRTI